jgi:hypothetical protein
MSSRVVAFFGFSEACQNQPGLMETSHSAGTQSCPKGSPLREYLAIKLAFFSQFFFKKEAGSLNYRSMYE